ncbi:hypothetical protein GT037_010103 [Alternaria burnsii]|uniref:Uncharacterized protein n=1 Tax=Alternaria burnsii TaxID=1187904 RepID=A0A8H7B2Z2_9PLEO|nr:uncharacterized protein GT037_010103 [Alternaria burnsii]KAF7671880.1 hypothetical protein GT037_010103 [Alternaria burnsii]
MSDHRRESPSQKPTSRPTWVFKESSKRCEKGNYQPSSTCTLAVSLDRLISILTCPLINPSPLSVGGEYVSTPLTEITTEQLRYNFNIAFEMNFFAYRATIPYLLAQKHPTSTWTLCNGAQGETAFFPVPGMTQGALFTMSTAAARENEKTNVRFNEVYLCFRVEVDEQAEKHGVTCA